MKKTTTERSHILSTEDVKKGEAIFALLYLNGNEPVAHLIKIVDMKGKSGLKRFLRSVTEFDEVRDTFLYQVAKD